MARARANGTKPKSSPPKRPASIKGPKRASGTPARASPPPPAAERAQRLRAAWTEVLEGRGLRLAESLDGLTLWAGALPSPAAWEVATIGLWSQGAELTMRFARSPDEHAPPPGVLAALRAVATALKASARPLSDQESVTTPAPLFADRPTELTSIVLKKDPSFRRLETKWDGFEVLLAVGITSDEAKLLREWSPQGFLEVYGKASPGLITEPDRRSLLASPRARAVIDQRVEREGSSLQVLTVDTSALKGAQGQTVWTLGVEAVEAVVSLLKGRVSHQRAFKVQAGASLIEVQPADAPSVTVLDGGSGVLKLSQPAARQLRAQLRPRPGRFTIDALAHFAIEVV